MRVPLVDPDGEPIAVLRGRLVGPLHAAVPERGDEENTQRGPPAHELVDVTLLAQPGGQRPALWVRVRRTAQRTAHSAQRAAHTWEAGGEPSA